MAYAILAIAVVALLGVFIWGMLQPVETERSIEKKARKEALRAGKQSAADKS